MKLLILLVLFFSVHSQAQALKSGIGISPSIGYTYIEIDNPDNTKSNYDGFIMQFDLTVPLYRNAGQGLNFHLLYKNSLVDNLSNNNNLSDKAKFYGAGAGLSYYYQAIGLGTTYNMMSANHSTSGVYSQTTEYSFKTITCYIDLAKRQTDYTFGGKFGYEFGELSTEETKYSKNVDFKAYSAIIYFTYITDFALF